MEGDRTATVRRARTAEIHTDVVYVLYSPDPDAKGERVVLTDDAFAIGRGAYAPSGLTFADAHMSRSHAELVRDGSGWRLTDTGSHNGTIINGRALSTAILASGDVLRFGGTVVLLRRCTLDRDTQRDTPGALVGQSFVMRRVRAELTRAAGDDAPILIFGESGVGKELAARHVAETGPRAKCPFVAVNCANLADHLAEAELFGHRSGAFTGATADRDGLFLAANGGTLFLDEIGEMTLDLQAKLLRALSTGEIRAVGAEKPRPVDVRVVAATNRNLDKEVEEGRFRGDLFARLAAWTIEIPPLRERQEDTLALATAHLQALGRSCELTSDAAEALVLYTWPYNVRELHNMVGVAGARAGQGPIDISDLPHTVRKPVAGRDLDASPSVAPSSPGSSTRPSSVQSPLIELLKRHRGNIVKVAESMGRDRRHVYRMLEEQEIDATAYRMPSAEELISALEGAKGSIAKVAETFQTNRKQVYRWLEKHSIDAASYRSPG